MENNNLAPATPPGQIIANRHFVDSPHAMHVAVNPSSNAVHALAQAFPNVNAANMLTNLHQFLGSKSNYSIAGSAALYIHACLAPNSDNTLPSRPNDLDLVVNEVAMLRSEGTPDQQKLSKLGLARSESNPGRYTYTDPQSRTQVGIDVIPSSRRLFGICLRDAEWMGDYQLAPLEPLLEGSRTQIVSPASFGEGLSDEKKAAIRMRLDYFRQFGETQH